MNNKSLDKLRKSADYYRDPEDKLWKITPNGPKLMKNAKPKKDKK